MYSITAMPKILFWNVNKTDLTEQVCNIVAENSVNIVILNECELVPKHLLDSLRATVSESFYIPRVNEKTSRFHVFCRNAKYDLQECHDSGRGSFRKFCLNGESVILA